MPSDNSPKVKLLVSRLEDLLDTAQGKDAQHTHQIGTMLTKLHDAMRFTRETPQVTNPSLIPFLVHAAYCAKRSTADYGDSIRQTAIESDAFESLEACSQAIDKLCIPLGLAGEHITNTLVRDLKNLSLAYVGSVVQESALEFIPVDEIKEAKMLAMRLATSAVRVEQEYANQRAFTPFFRSWFARSSQDIAAADKRNLTSFNIIAVEPKKMDRKDLMTSNVLVQLLQAQEQEGYVPDYVLPIAMGGIEFGAVISNFYDDLAVAHQTYPVFYSRKTRKQENPWIERDTALLSGVAGKNLLLVDDWITQGTTVRKLLDSLGRYGPKDIRVATLKRDPRNTDDAQMARHVIYAGALTPYNGVKRGSE